MYLHDLAKTLSLLVAFASFALMASKLLFGDSVFEGMTSLEDIIGGGGVLGRCSELILNCLKSVSSSPNNLKD